MRTGIVCWTYKEARHDKDHGTDACFIPNERLPLHRQRPALSRDSISLFINQQQEL